MEIYKLVYTKDAQDDIESLVKSGNKSAIMKLQKILLELKEHPRTGVGKPKILSHNQSGLWSRRIDHKNRIVYSIEEQTVTVTIINALNHYRDK